MRYAKPLKTLLLKIKCQWRWWVLAVEARLRYWLRDVLNPLPT
jgi:hypothetical protein